MDVFLHHIYEYKKGLRRMVLHTAPSLDRANIARKLDGLEINYIILGVNESKINVFFGDSWCIGVIRSFAHLDLSRLTDEQDFILGTLLGYDTVIQCRRYLQRKRNGTIMEHDANVGVNLENEPKGVYAE